MSLGILVLQAGQPAPALRNRAGDYVDWFADAFGPDIQLEPLPVFQGAPFPDPRLFDGVLMTGSPLSVRDYDREPWMQAAGGYLLRAAAHKPVLGVCFGEQLLARALGVAVTKNPRGREIGTIDVALTDEGRAHPILGKLASTTFQATHEDVAVELPKGATLLGQNAFGVQAFSVDEKILAVQFHPELDAARMRTLIDTRAEPLKAEGIYERARDAVRETPAGPQLLARWAASLR